MKHGGRREGSGGKKPKLPDDVKRIKINICVDQSTYKWLKSESVRLKKGQGRIIDDIVKGKINSG